MANFSVLDLLDLDLKEREALELQCIGGRPGLAREISVPDINRPGLTLSGFYENFGINRIQLFGKGEHAYLLKLEKEHRYDSLEKMFAYPFPCCVFTHDLNPTKDLIRIAESHDCPILQTPLGTSQFSQRIIRVLGNTFAPKQSVHGVLVEVFGIGILITGDSGVGKSETALELIERGHRLIADDVVEIKCLNGNSLTGSSCNEIMGHHMEIRGLGIINIAHLFGVGAIRDSKLIQIVVQLEPWDADKVYDRVGVGDNTIEILGVAVSCVNLPVKPGRNIPILIETAAMTARLKKMGYFSAREFDANVLKWLESENARKVYFDRKDSF